MHIKFTHHAQYRLYQRSFSTEDMKLVINHPDFTRLSSDGKIVSEKTLKEGRMRVVYFKRGITYVIISVYYLK